MLRGLSVSREGALACHGFGDTEGALSVDVLGRGYDLLKNCIRNYTAATVPMMSAALGSHFSPGSGGSKHEEETCAARSSSNSAWRVSRCAPRSLRACPATQSGALGKVTNYNLIPLLPSRYPRDRPRGIGRKAHAEFRETLHAEFEEQSLALRLEVPPRLLSNAEMSHANMSLAQVFSRRNELSTPKSLSRCAPRSLRACPATQFVVYFKASYGGYAILGFK